MFSQFDDSLKNMQNKIFYIWIALCLLANIIGTLFNFIAQGWASVTKVCFYTGLAMVFVVAIAIFINKKELASALIFIMLSWIEFPALYFAYGNVVMAYFILSLFAGTIVFPFNGYLVFSITSGTWYGMIIWFASENDSPLIRIYSEMTYLLVAIAVVVIQLSILYYYERQKKKLSDANAEIEYIAEHDQLTGLFNRVHLIPKLCDDVANGDNFLLSLIDLDNFKSINDTHGHQVGDEVLKKLGETITHKIEDKGYSARYGGEEIAIIFYGSDENEFRSLLLEIRNEMNSYFKSKYDINITFSGGLVSSEGFDSVNNLIKRVDEKLYEAKNSGKDKIIS